MISDSYNSGNDSSNRERAGKDIQKHDLKCYNLISGCNERLYKKYNFETVTSEQEGLSFANLQIGLGENSLQSYHNQSWV